jgi:GAF domain-containing protein/HAMP domain-containing protein
MTTLRRLLNIDAWSVATKLAAAMSVLLVLAAGSIGLLGSQAATTLRSEAIQQDFRHLSEGQASLLATRLSQELWALNELASNEVIQEHLKRQNALPLGSKDAYLNSVAYLNSTLFRLYNFHSLHPEFGRVVITDRYGRLVDDTLYPPEPTATFESEVWWQRAYADGMGSIYLAQLEEADAGETLGLAIGMPIPSGPPGAATGDVLGVIYAEWSNIGIAQMAEDLGTGGLLLVGAEGKVMFDSAAPSPTRPQYALPPDVVARIGQPSGFLTGLDEHGQPAVYGYASLADVPGLAERVQEVAFGETCLPALRDLGWTVVVHEDARSALAPAAQAGRRLALIAAMSALASVVLTFVVTGSVVRPLGRLTEAAARIGRGELETPIPQLGQDEIGRLAQTLRDTVQRLGETAIKLRITADISRIATQAADLDKMLAGVVNALHQQFNYTDVRIYLADPGQDSLWLRASAGDESRALRSRRVAIDETTPIGWAMSLGQPETSGATATTEVALPLRASDRTLGVLYVAADQPGALEPEDVDILQLLADQVGASIQNLHLLESSAASLAEIEALSRRLTRSGWVEYLSQTSLRHTPDPAARWPAALQPTLAGSPVAQPTTDADGRSLLAAPILLRGEPIGMLGVTRPPGHRWSEDEIALVEAVADRMAMIAEGIRLLEEAERAAHREATVSSVSAQLQRAADVEGVVQNALRELAQALGSDHIALHLGPPTPESDSDGDQYDATPGQEAAVDPPEGD